VPDLVFEDVAAVNNAIYEAESYLDRQLARIDPAISVYSDGKFCVRKPEAKS